MTTTGRSPDAAYAEAPIILQAATPWTSDYREDAHAARPVARCRFFPADGWCRTCAEVIPPGALAELAYEAHPACVVCRIERRCSCVAILHG